MKVTRKITIYEKVGERLIGSIEIDLPLDILLNIIDDNRRDDPKLHQVYRLNDTQIKKLQEFIPELSDVELSDFDVFYECFQK